MAAKYVVLMVSAVVAVGAACASPTRGAADYSPLSRVSSGRAVAVMLTSYSTTLRANGSDEAALRVAVSDSASREITTATDAIRVYVTGNGTLVSSSGVAMPTATDSAGTRYTPVQLEHGVATLAFRAGAVPGIVKVEARSGTLFVGAHEIHTIPASVALKSPLTEQLPPTSKPIARMIGADISWLPEIESRTARFPGRLAEFRENGTRVDAINLLKRHGVNTIRLRVFVNPENPKGYAPGIGFCGLDSTLSMARRVKAAGMGLLLDFHYSDYWADPQQQNKPLRWASLPFDALRDSVQAYTARVLTALKAQGTLPDMVQIGNEINHGMLWPDGHIGQLDQLAALLRAGVDGTESVDARIPIMMHIALGGQNAEARFWLDNMLARGVRFDIIGLSYYPRWHGTLENLDANLRDLTSRYHKPVNVVEYSDFAAPVHDIVYALPGDFGKGAAIWEPLNARSGLFDSLGNVTAAMRVYDSLRVRHLGAPSK